MIWPGIVGCLSASALAAVLFAPSAAAAAERCPELAQLQSDPRWAPTNPHDVTVVINRVDVGPGGELRWNRSLVTERVLGQYLAIVATMEPRPLILLAVAQRPDCDLLQRVKMLIEERGECFGKRCTFGLLRAERLSL